MAREKLQKLNSSKVTFADALKHGDRFLYHNNYVERVPEFVAAHFGDAMAEEVFSLDADNLTWHGPFASPYGYHLVLVSENQTGRFPQMSEMEARLRSDALRAAVNLALADAERALIDNYEVELTYQPQEGR